VTWLIASQYGQYRGYQEAKTEYSADASTDKINRACAGFSGPQHIRCRFEVEKDSEEASRTEKDLQAQREVALWTFWLMWISIGGLALTGGGIYYLAANLSEMQSQRRLMRAQLAPHLVLPETCSYVIARTHISFHMTIQNNGLSTPDMVEIGGSIRFSEDDFTANARLFRVELWGMPVADIKPQDKREIEAHANADDFPDGQYKRLYEDGVHFQILMHLKGVDALADRTDFTPQRLSAAHYTAITDQKTVSKAGARVEKHGTMKRRN